MPFLMLELKKIGMPMSWAPLGLMFCLIAWPRAPEPRRRWSRRSETIAAG